jgi:hypothetical protein
MLMFSLDAGSTPAYSTLIAEVAQLVERWFCKPNVTGSFPVFGFMVK